jgi:lysophospholipase L1-like esterase
VAVRQLVRNGALAGALVLSLEAAYALLRPAPDLPDFDPSGEFGNPDHPTLRVVVLGDSSVTAPGVEDPDQIWVRIVGRRMGQSRHVILRSVAVGGSTARTVLEGQLEEAILADPDIALVSVGANDAIHGVQLRRFERDLDRIVADLSDTGALVFLSGVGDLGTIPRLYPPLRGIMTRRSLAYHRAHRRVAARHDATVIEHRSDDRKLWLRDRSLWSEDLFHVSASGHARWADFTWKVVEPALASLDG